MVSSNEQLVTRIFAAVDAGRYEELNALCTSDYRDHGATGDTDGLPGFVEMVEGFSARRSTSGSRTRRIVDGKAAEHWGLSPQAAQRLFTQMGVDTLVPR